MTTNPSTQAREDAAHPETALPRKYGLKFASCYAYSPKGESEVSVRSRQLCARVKGGSTKWLSTYVACVHQEAALGLQGFFNEHTLLVPIPNEPSSKRSFGWVARRLAVAMKRVGLADDVWDGLRRLSRVERSASAWMWQRPTVKQHYESFAVIQPARPPSDIVLIDDVVTKGRTLLAAALRMRQAFPTADIRAFALVRTMGFVPNVERLLDPCVGVIRWHNEDAYRVP